MIRQFWKCSNIIIHWLVSVIIKYTVTDRIYEIAYMRTYLDMTTLEGTSVFGSAIKFTPCVLPYQPVSWSSSHAKQYRELYNRMNDTLVAHLIHKFTGIAHNFICFKWWYAAIYLDKWHSWYISRIWWQSLACTAFSCNSSLVNLPV